MQNPFTATCPEFLPNAYHSKTKWLFHFSVEVVLVGMLLWWVHTKVYESPVLGLVAVIPAAVVGGGILQFAGAIMHCRTGGHIYLTRFIFLRKRHSQNDVYEMHGGQLYDFWAARQERKKTLSVARDYYRSIRALAEKIDAGVIPPDAIITATTWFLINERAADKLKSMGFTEEKPSVMERASFFLTKWDIWLKYLLVSGDVASAPNVFRIAKYSARAQDVVQAFHKQDECHHDTGYQDVDG